MVEVLRHGVMIPKGYVRFNANDVRIADHCAKSLALEVGIGQKDDMDER